MEKDIQINKTVRSDAISFRCDRKMVKVLLNDILFIESIQDYIKIVTVTNTIITKQSISLVEDILPKELFIRIHRSYIVALNKIGSFTHEMERIEKQQLPISRMYRHEVEALLDR